MTKTKIRTTRPRGRPRHLSIPAAVGAPDRLTDPRLSRELILAKALEMAKAEPLAELSMVGLAREFAVAPGLIHYYIGSRDELISGVVNRYFRTRVEQFTPATGDWRSDIATIARTTYDVMVEHGGVLRYIQSHNRYRLFQKVAADETDYGVAFFDRVLLTFRDGGFAAKEAALAYHLLMQFVTASAFAQVSRQLPAEHADYLRERIAASPKSRYPGAHYVARTFPRLDAPTVFDAGLQILIDGFSNWK